MTSDALSCPFCNAFLPAASAAGETPLLHCPRCGEKLPARLTQAIQARAALTAAASPLDADVGGEEEEATSPAPPASPLEPSAAALSTGPDRAAMRRTVLIVLAVMAAMVVVALSFAWNTEDFRRAHDLQRPVRPRLNVVMLITGVILVGSWSWLYYAVLAQFHKKQAGAAPSQRQEVWELVLFVAGLMAVVLAVFGLPLALPRPNSGIESGPGVTPPPRPIPIFELPAVAYLAPDTGVLLAIRVADAEKIAAGKEFLHASGFGPGKTNDLEKWTGLPLDAIDHAMLGLKVENRFPLPLVLVVEARRPVDSEKVRHALKSTRSTQVGQKTLHHFNVAAGKLSLEAVLWFAGPQTLVVALSKGEFEALPDKPGPGTRLTTTLDALLRERVDATAPALLAGAIDNWSAFGPLLSVFVPKEQLDTLTAVRRLGCTLRFDDGVRLNGAVRCVDEPAAEALETKWSKIKPDEEALKDWLPFARELARSFHCERNEDWITIDARASAEAAKASTK